MADPINKQRYRAARSERMAQALAQVFRFKSATLAAMTFGAVRSPHPLSRTLFGQEFVCDVSRGITHQMLFLTGERAIEERHLVRGLLRAGMHVVDIGANIGYYLLMIEAAVGRDGKVTVIEPAPENLAELKRNIAVNGYRNVELHDCAIGNTEGEVGLKDGINSGVTALEGATAVASLRPLGSIVRDPVDFIKIDVEGYEGQVLQGARSIITRDLPILFIEVHPHMVGRYGFTTSGVIDELRMHYDDIRYYEVARATKRNLRSKLAEKYFRPNPMKPIVAAGDFLQRCEKGEIHHPFWAVCNGDSSRVIRAK